MAILSFSASAAPSGRTIALPPFANSTGEHRDFAVEAVAQAVLLEFQVITRLQIQPEAFRRSKKASQAEGCIGSNSALAPNDFIDPPRRNAYVLGKPVLADSQRSQKLFEQHLAGRNRRYFASGHIQDSVIVRNLNVARVALFPVKADPPLIVHTDAVLSCAVAVQFFQPIPRRHTQVVERIRGVQQQQLAQRGTLHWTRYSLYPFAKEQSFGFPV